MKTADFKFKLPKSLIAKYPKLERSRCRLLLLDQVTGKISHHFFSDLTNKLVPGDLLVFNDTRVLPARLYGCTDKGRKIEILIERILNSYRVLAHIKASIKIELGTSLIFGKDCDVFAYISGYYNNNDKLFIIDFRDNNQDVLSILNNIGHIPIPPYLKRLDEEIDYELYQTVYGKCPGSIAAPTAGLHFDSILLNILSNLGIEMAFITLHIGSATFQPVWVDTVEHHIMHDEYIEVSQKTVESILRCKSRGNRVIAVGTTVVKSLETASIYAKSNSMIESFYGYARTFIIPGYDFRIVDGLITNFHLPQSTLVMLVAAFAGYHNIFNAYYEAIRLQYKFLSYGDSMLITRNLTKCDNRKI